MSIDNLYDFFKKINYSRILPVLLCPVLFLCTSISVFAAEVSPDAVNEWFLLPFNEFGDFVGQFDDTQGTYYATGSGSIKYLQFEVGTTNSSVLPLLKAGNKYLIYGTVSLASSNSTGSPSSISLYEFINDRTQPYQWSNSYLDKHVDYNRSTYTISGIYNFTMSENIFLNTGGALVWEQTVAVDFNGRCSWAFYALDVTDTSESEVDEIVAAINNQTTNIMNAGSGFGGTTSGIQSGNNELSEYIDEYTQIEQTMHNSFESAQSALIGDFTGFTWGSLANTLSWTSDYMQQIYLNSGDFKMMIVLPLLLGIALFFIGRGAIILSNSNKDN